MLYDKDGQEIEGALTAEEVEQRLEDNAKESTEKVNTLEADLTKAKEDLKSLSEKDTNFGKARKQIKELENELKEAKETTGKKDEEIKSVKIDSIIKKYTGDDKEVFDNVKNEFEMLKDATDTDEDLDKKVKRAFLLATGTSPKRSGGLGSDAFGHSGGTPIVDKQMGKLENPESVSVARKLGIKDEDLKKHGLL